MSARSVLMTSATLLLAACASSNSLDTTDPVLEAQGAVAPQRNLLLSDLSVGSPGNGRAVDELFDLAVASFRVAPDPNGSQTPNGLAPKGLVRGSTSTEFFGSGNTMTYVSATNSFVFDVDTDAGTFAHTVQNIQVQDPVDYPGVDNSGIAKLIFANPLYYFDQNTDQPVNFQDIYDLGLGPNASISAITAELTRLQTSTVEADNDFFNAIANSANSYIQAADQFLYGFAFTGGKGYVEATNMNSDDAERVTDTVAIVSLKEFLSNGEEFHGHAVFGHRTPLAEMPTSGTATYRGKVVGDVLTNNSVRSLTGGIDMDVNFTTGLMDMTLATQIREGSDNAGGTTFLDYKTLSGSGVLSDTTFDGSLNELGGDAVGSYQGAFFGPSANEVGGTFEFGDSASYAAGAFTGRKVDDPTN